MSSILKALQKLDSNSSVKVEPEPLSGRVDTKRLHGRRLPARSQTLPRLVGFAAVGLLLLGSGVILLQHVFLTGRSPEPPPTASRLEQARDKVADSTGKVKPPAAAAPSPDVAAVPETAPPAVSQPAPLSAAQPPAAPRADRSAVRPPATAATGQAEMARKETWSLTEAGPKPEAQPLLAGDDAGHDRTVLPPAPAVQDRGGPAAGFPKPSMKRLAASVMTLQAITWSSDPDACFALIDNQIVRRGDTVAGYVIKAISEDYVVVAKGGENWRVEFRHRSP